MRRSTKHLFPNFFRAYPPKRVRAASLLRNRRIQWFIVATYAAFLLVISLAPSQSLPKIPDWNLLFTPDKVAHFGAYGLFAVLLSVIFSERWGGKGISLAVIVAAFYGFLIEVLQGLAGTGRNYDPVDMVANLLGAVLGGFFVLAFYQYQKKRSPR
ncbi:MAG: VanZ family protein [Bacteroidota bacterium]